MGKTKSEITERLFSDYCLLDKEGFLIREKGNVDRKMKIFAGKIFSPDKDFIPEEIWWCEDGCKSTHISFSLNMKGRLVLFAGKIKNSRPLSEVRYFLPELRSKLTSEPDFC